VLEEPGIHLSLNPTLALVASGARIEYARWVKRDERRAAQELFDFALACRGGGTQFERFPVEWRESMLSSAPAVIRETSQLMRPFPSRAALASIRCPVTLMQGSHSQSIFHKVNRQLSKLLPGAELVEIGGTAHAVHFDRPEQFREAVSAAAARSSVPA